MEVKKLPKVEKDLTAEELRQAESRVGVRLPDEYRRFLLKHNGGHPEPYAFRFKCEGKEPKIGHVAYFLAVYEGENENFFDYFETYQERIPPQLIPIARDPGGNLILLGVTGKYTGKVYYWMQDFEPEQPDFSNICFVADSFDEFFNSLSDDHDE